MSVAFEGELMEGQRDGLEAWERSVRGFGGECEFVEWGQGQEEAECCWWEGTEFGVAVGEESVDHILGSHPFWYSRDQSFCASMSSGI